MGLAGLEGFCSVIVDNPPFFSNDCARPVFLTYMSHMTKQAKACIPFPGGQPSAAGIKLARVPSICTPYHWVPPLSCTSSAPPTVGFPLLQYFRSLALPCPALQSYIRTSGLIHPSIHPSGCKGLHSQYTLRTLPLRCFKTRPCLALLNF